METVKAGRGAAAVGDDELASYQQAARVYTG